MLWRLFAPFTGTYPNLSRHWWHRLLIVLFWFLVFTCGITAAIYYRNHEDAAYIQCVSNYLASHSTTNDTTYYEPYAAPGSPQNPIRMTREEYKAKFGVDPDVPTLNNPPPRIQFWLPGMDPLGPQPTDALTDIQKAAESTCPKPPAIDIIVTIVGLLFALFAAYALQLVYYKIILYIAYGRPPVHR